MTTTALFNVGDTVRVIETGDLLHINEIQYPYHIGVVGGMVKGFREEELGPIHEADTVTCTNCKSETSGYSCHICMVDMPVAKARGQD